MTNVRVMEASNNVLQQGGSKAGYIHQPNHLRHLNFLFEQPGGRGNLAAIKTAVAHSLQRLYLPHRTWVHTPARPGSCSYDVHH
jgi:hypothetical protein